MQNENGFDNGDGVTPHELMNVLSSFARPSDPKELADDDMKFKKGTIAALRKFKEKKTFRMDDDGRLDAMRDLVYDLCGIYEMDRVTVEAENLDGLSSGTSQWDSANRMIIMRGKLSIITLLHEFYHAKLDGTVAGHNEVGAMKRAVNLFKRVYPKQYRKLTGDRGLLVKDNS